MPRSIRRHEIECWLCSERFVNTDILKFNWHLWTAHRSSFISHDNKSDEISYHTTTSLGYSHLVNVGLWHGYFFKIEVRSPQHNDGERDVSVFTMVANGKDSANHLVVDYEITVKNRCHLQLDRPVLPMTAIEVDATIEAGYVSLKDMRPNEIGTIQVKIRLRRKNPSYLL